MTDEKFAPTPAEDYPVIEDQQLTLPSGARVVVRQPSVFGLVSRGQVPSRVRELLDRAVMPKAKKVSEAEMMEVLNFLVAASYVKPPVSLVPKKGHVLLSRIPDEDRLAVIKALGLREVI